MPYPKVSPATKTGIDMEMLIQALRAISPTSFEEKKDRVFYGLEAYAVHYEIGNCLFEAAAAGTAEMTGAKVREYAVAQLRTDAQLQERIRAGIGHDEDRLKISTGELVFYASVEEYITLMSQDQTWGTHVEIVAIARALKRPLVLLTPGNRYDDIIEEPEYESQEPIFLNYVGMNHYEPLHTKPGENPFTILQRIRKAIQERGRVKSKEIAGGVEESKETTIVPYDPVPRDETPPMGSPVPDREELIDSALVLTKNADAKTVLTLKQKDPEFIQAIVRDPKSAGLEKESLVYKIIVFGQRKKTDEKTLAEIRKIEEIDPFKLGKYFSLTPVDNSGWDVFHWCAVFNYAKVSDYLSSKGYASSSDKERFSDMDIAAMAGHQDYVLDQIERIPELHWSTLRCTSAAGITSFQTNTLHLAILAQHTDLAKMIFDTLQDRLDSDARELGNILHVVIAAKDLSLLSHALRHSYKGAPSLGSLLLGKDHFRRTSLMLACEIGWLAGVKVLLDFFAFNLDITQGLELLQEAFYHAARLGQFHTVEFLLNSGFKPTIGEDYEETMRRLSGEPKSSPQNRIYHLIQKRAKEDYYHHYKKPDPKTQIYSGLVLQGGGTKGLAYVYALEALEASCEARATRAGKAQLKINHIKRVAGTSAGAIAGMLYAFGYTPEEMMEKMDMDFSEFFEGSRLGEVVGSEEMPIRDKLIVLLRELGIEIENLIKTAETVKSSGWPKMRAFFELLKHPINIYTQTKLAIRSIQSVNHEFQGFSSGAKVTHFLRSLMAKKEVPEDITFGEWAERVKTSEGRLKHLYVVVTNLDRCCIEVLSSENPDYKDYIVLDAVRASLSLPLVFVPCHLRIKQGDKIATRPETFIDGGLLRNFAIDEFDRKFFTDPHAVGDRHYPTFNPETLGLRFKPTAEAEDIGSKTLLDYLLAIVNYYRRAQRIISTYLDAEYGRGIELNTGKITTLTFKRLSAEEKTELEKNAYEAVEQYFSSGSHGKVHRGVVGERKPPVSRDGIFSALEPTPPRVAGDGSGQMIEKARSEEATSIKKSDRSIGK